MKRLTKVGVIVACERNARHIPGCLESILSQAGVQVAVLLVGDSSEWTSAVGAAAARADGRVTYVEHEPPREHETTGDDKGFPCGWSDCTVVLPAGDRLVPGALARATGVLDRYPEVGMVYGCLLSFASDDELPLPRTGGTEPEVWKGSDWIAERCRTAEGVEAPQVVVRTDLLCELGGYRSVLPLDPDNKIWLRLAARAEIAFLPGVDHAYRRVRSGSLGPEHVPSDGMKGVQPHVDVAAHGQDRDLRWKRRMRTVERRRHGHDSAGGPGKESPKAGEGLL